MSQDLIRTPRSGLAGFGSSLAVDDAWGAGGPTTALAPAGLAQSQPQPLAKIHRLLRGRYALAITLALAGAMLGGLGGWMSQRPMYRSMGWLQIRPIIFSEVGRDGTIPFYTHYMVSQANHIQSVPVIEQALQRPEYKNAGGVVMPAGAVQGSLQARYISNSNHIQVVYENENPKIAAAVVRAMLKAYQVRHGDNTSVTISGLIRQLEERLLRIADEVRQTKAEILGVAKQYGTDDLSEIHSRELRRQDETQTQLATLSERRSRAEEALAMRKQSDNAQALTEEELALDDAYLKTLLNHVADLQFRIDKAKLSLNDRNPYVRTLNDEMLLTRQRIDQRVTQLREQYPAKMTDPVTGNIQLVDERVINDLTNREDQLRSTLAEIDSRVRRIGDDRMRLREFRNNLENLATEEIRVAQRLDARKGEALTSGGILEIIDEGQFPRVSNDGRTKMALMGSAAGGAIPIGLILLWGLLDSRFRYSDEAAAAGSPGSPTLLGILPNLPDRLSDPNQASVAAHCVHQIRTMLQLNALGDGPGAFVVTSATSGDGKTSLTLALGLSFAASGSRTLLIDSDLVGAGLSARLDVNDETGVIEALSTGDPLAYARETEVADLALLPVGNAGAHHAGNFAPAAMRRLIGEAKKHFDIILIDTGPLLGSIEATPVAASVDGVILTVARGQSRPMVDKALTHLKHIGATLAGVVFNRAQANDFEQSINGMSVSSAARSAQQQNLNGHARSRKDADASIGPVARAVAETNGRTTKTG